MNKFISIILIIAASIMFYSWQYNSDLKEINNIISDHNGKVITIEDRSFNIGPFEYKGKHFIYKIEYIDKDTRTVREAWMRTGLFNDDWVWDYKEDYIKEKY